MRAVKRQEARALLAIKPHGASAAMPLEHPGFYQTGELGPLRRLARQQWQGVEAVRRSSDSERFGAQGVYITTQTAGQAARD
jgi:hypothetical protein